MSLIAGHGLLSKGQIGRGHGLAYGGAIGPVTRARIDLGQSNRMGLKAADQTKTQPYDNVMVASGVGSWITDVQSRTQDRTATAPLIEYNNYETGTAYGLNRMKELYATLQGTTWDKIDRNYFGTNSAVAGKTIAQLSAGAEVARTRADINAIRPLFGDTISIDWITFIQGFSDASATTAGYKASIAGYHTLLTDEIALTYPDATPQMMICQHSSQRYTGQQAKPTPSLGQVEFANETDGVFVMGPMYQCLWRDNGVHMAWQGQQLMEAYLTQAIFEQEQGTWGGPVTFSVTSWTDTTITLQVVGGTGSYVLDNAQVGAAVNSGFDIYAADEATLENVISSVSIAGSIVTINLSAPTSASAVLAYGWGRSDQIIPSAQEIPLGNLHDTGRGVTVTINTIVYTLDNPALISAIPKV